jgi:hypothetical protein
MAEAQQENQEVQQLEPPDEQPAVHKVKLAWGDMMLCRAIQCPGGTTEYSSFKPEVLGEDGAVEQPQVQHCLPSMLSRHPGHQPFQYAAQLSEIPATCLSGIISLVPNGPRVKVYLPYRPVGRHG